MSVDAEPCDVCGGDLVDGPTERNGSISWTCLDCLSDEDGVDYDAVPRDVCGVNVLDEQSPTTRNGYALTTCLGCYEKVPGLDWDEDKQKLI